MRGGLRVLEVTLRTEAALDAIREMKKVPGAIVGAGTVVSTDQFEQVMKADAEFIVSPGLTDRLGEAIVGSGVPFLAIAVTLVVLRMRAASMPLGRNAATRSPRFTPSDLRTLANFCVSM